ncbi:unnamed protein product [Angiostrongylus costaricensis]|uniref:Endo/exonuclease/phosphatase domain-containing protein n=1 Tax=Angiostrongylus costaricensis TaxID=334426 RepID=A0A0R3PXD3_ANGCS|nr:unnamed protein product [Angiostrongylus costaricensis]
MNIDSFEQLTTRIGRLPLKRCGSIPALTIFVVYASTSNCEEEGVEEFYMDLEKFYREDHTFSKVITGDLNAKIGQRRTSVERNIWTHGLEWNEHGNTRAIRQRGIARVVGNHELMFQLAKQCRQATKEDHQERREAVKIVEAAEVEKSIRKAHQIFAIYNGEHHSRILLRSQS